ncbi:hypothetical protein J8273_5919 [Carpediemonas membranifera]|nr:hypothetical protein J8273_5919 [Carpediemonas membranifera]|eukprot:KAG9392775.1 hypothetical protein J8273_5919 [Carpediemonas membranifera]
MISTYLEKEHAAGSISAADVATGNRICNEVVDRRPNDLPTFVPEDLRDEAEFRSLDSIEQIMAQYKGESSEAKEKRFRALISLDAEGDEVDHGSPLLATVREYRELFHGIPQSVRPRAYAFVAQRLGISVDKVREVLLESVCRKDSKLIFERPQLVLKKHSKTFKDLAAVIEKRNAARAAAEARDVLRIPVYASLLLFHAANVNSNE